MKRLSRLTALVLMLSMLLTGFSLAEAPSPYPIPGDITLTYFGQLHKKVATSYTGWEALDVVNDWFDITGVKLEFHCPPSGMEEDQFNLMLASGDYTDIIVYEMMGLDGGLTKLYNDGVIVDLTDYLPEFAPNYWKYLNDNPIIKRQVMDDNGRVFCFVFAKGGGALLSTTGPILREDILAELKLEKPETIEDWGNLLRAVKAAYPTMIPFTGWSYDLLRSFSPAFGVSNGAWYVDNEGVARYAPMEPGFKDFLQQMNAWYQEGLIDEDFVSLDDAGADNKVSAGLAFATFGAGSAQISAYMAANKDNPTFSTIGVKLPTLEKGQLAQYATEFEATANAQMAISTKNQHVEETIRMYDWGYSPEGSVRLNWGVEGVSYTVDENGKYHYTDMILHPAEGKSVDSVLSNYALTAVKGPAMLVQDPEYMLQYYSLPQQKIAMENWSEKDLNSKVFPSLSYQGDESATVTRVMADVQTYVNTMTLKFILGSEPFENYEGFLNTLKGMGIEEAIAAQQTAVDRYNAR